MEETKVNWISTKDRLPEYGEAVLVHVDYDLYDYVAFAYLDLFTKEWKEAGNENRYPIDAVTHWAPYVEFHEGE